MTNQDLICNFEKYYKDPEDNSLEIGLFTQLLVHMLNKILIESEEIYPHMGIISNPKQQLYYPIPNAQEYAHQMANLFYKLDIPKDASLSLVTIWDKDSPSFPKLVLNILLPNEQDAFSLGIGLLKENIGAELSLMNASIRKMEKKYPYLDTIFTPYIPYMILGISRVLEDQYKQIKLLPPLFGLILKNGYTESE